MTLHELHFFPVLVFFCFLDAFKVNRNAKLIFSNFQKTGNKHLNPFEHCFYAVGAERSLRCRPSPGSHCHTSVECRSSAPIDLEAHNPTFKVQRAPRLWFLLLLKQATAREREREREREQFCDTKQPPLGLRQLLNSLKLLWGIQRFQTRVSPLQVAFSSKHR